MNNKNQKLGLQKKFSLSLSVLLILFLFPTINTNAKSKKIPNCLKSIVVFSVPSSDSNKNRVTGTGFIVKYNDKLVVATNLDIIYHTLKPKIKTIDGNELKYSKILIPKDKRNTILFEIDPDTPEDIYKSLELESDVSEETDINDKVLTFGCKSNWETITSAKGKISGLGPVNIEIEARVPYNMNGGPVISYNTGKVIGVLSRLASYFGEKKNKTQFCKGTRIDSIKEMTALSEDDFLEDLKKLKQKEAILLSVYDRYTKFTLAIDKLSEKIVSGLGTQQTAISKLEKQHQADVKKIKSIINQMNSDKAYSMEYFQSRHKHAVVSAKEMIATFEELSERFEELEKENKKAAEKSTLKGIDLNK